MKRPGVRLFVSICAGYILAFLIMLALYDRVSDELIECIAFLVYVPIAIWFLPLISTSSGEGLNPGQWSILVGSVLLNAVFMGWLLTAIARRVHIRIARSRSRHKENGS